MKVIHVLPALSRTASGPTYSVVRLCQELIREGKDCRLAALEFERMEEVPEFARLFAIGLGPIRLGRSPEMYRWLRQQARGGAVDVIHGHGMWQMSGVYPSWAAAKGAIPFVCSPRGAFSNWAMRHGSNLKRVFWPLLQRPALVRASCFHATAEAEYRDIRRLGFKQPVAIIPNGIDLPLAKDKPGGSQRTALFLARIHPVKGLDRLLPAWKAVQDEFPEWRLVIAGDDEGYYGSTGYREQVMGQCQEMGLKRVQFVGAIYGADRSRAYHEAALYVLPSYSENFGISVAEALSHGTPAIVSTGAPWAGLVDNDSGWWVDCGVDSLATTLRDALALPRTELAKKGENGRLWMSREFSWAAIGGKMVQTYRWLMDGSSLAPEWVRVD